MSEYTVGELRRALQAFGDDTKVSFDGGMTVSKVEAWGDNEAVIHMNEIQAELSPKFKKEHPEVFVAYCRVGETDKRVQVVTVPRL